jgi:EF hand
MSRMMVFALFFIFASTAVCAATLERPLKPATSFGYLDVDKDARISPGEAKADWAVVQRFQEADADHNGFLDASEFESLTRWTMTHD